MAGGYPCCCVPPSGACGVCLPGTHPNQYRIDLAGIVNRFSILCANCPSLNGSYIVTKQGAGTGGECWYRLNFPAVCGYSRIELTINPGVYGVTIIDPNYPGGLNSGSPLQYQKQPQASPRDCRTNLLLINPVSFMGNCNHLPSTCRITAI